MAQNTKRYEDDIFKSRRRKTLCICPRCQKNFYKTIEYYGPLPAKMFCKECKKIK